MAFGNARGLVVSRTISEIGSGLNGRRPKLLKLLADPAVQTIVVEHRDKLMRLPCEYAGAALTAQGRRLMVADPGEVKGDLVQDMVEMLTSFCARLFGRRAARNRAKKALAALEAPK